MNNNKSIECIYRVKIKAFCRSHECLWWYMRSWGHEVMGAKLVLSSNLWDWPGQKLSHIVRSPWYCMLYLCYIYVIIGVKFLVEQNQWSTASSCNKEVLRGKCFICFASILPVNCRGSNSNPLFSVSTLLKIWKAENMATEETEGDSRSDWHKFAEDFSMHGVKYVHVRNTATQRRYS